MAVKLPFRRLTKYELHQTETSEFDSVHLAVECPYDCMTFVHCLGVSQSNCPQLTLDLSWCVLELKTGLTQNYLMFGSLVLALMASYGSRMDSSGKRHP